MSLLSMLSGSGENERKQAANSLMSKLNSDDSSRLEQIVSDKEKLNAILNSPAATEIIKKLNGNGQH